MLQDHEVYEHAWLHVHDGEVEIDQNGTTTRRPPASSPTSTRTSATRSARPADAQPAALPRPVAGRGTGQELQRVAAERHREQLVGVGVELLELQAGRREVALSRSRVNFALISVRISSRVAKCDVEVERLDAHVLRRERAQAHLDPLVLAVEERDVLEGVDVEVGAELAVDDVQDVAVERRGDARGVVVGGLDDRRVLDEVGAEQQAVARRAATWPSRAGTPPAAGQEVADRAAEERDDARCRPRAGRSVEMALEVADDAVDAQPRVVLDQRSAASRGPRARRRRTGT